MPKLFAVSRRVCLCIMSKFVKMFCTFQKYNFSAQFLSLSHCNSHNMIKLQVFWDVTPCRLVNIYRGFEGAYCFLLQGETRL
jgi:hypothetical protein